MEVVQLRSKKLFGRIEEIACTRSTVKCDHILITLYRSHRSPGGWTDQVPLTTAVVRKLTTLKLFLFAWMKF